MARAAIFSLISEDPALQTMGINNENVYGSNAFDSGPRDVPFVVISFGDTNKSFADRGSTEITIWIHVSSDKTHDYTEISMIRLRIRELMQEANQIVGSDGWILTAATWRGDSGDLIDEGYNTIALYSAFSVSYRSVITG